MELNGFEKFRAVRETIGDKAVLDELMQILNFDQLEECAEDLVHNLDLGRVWM